MGVSTDHLPHQETILCIYYTHLPKYIHFCKAGRKEGELKKGWGNKIKKGGGIKKRGGIKKGRGDKNRNVNPLLPCLS